MNPSVVTKDLLEGVSYPIAGLDRRHPCLPVERVGVKNRVDAEEDGRRIAVGRKQRYLRFLIMF